MPSSDTRPKKRRFSSNLLRLAALAGVVVGLGSLFRPQDQQHAASFGRGRPGIPPSAGSLDQGHETLDFSARTLSLIFAGMVATTAVVIGIVFLMTWRFDVARTARFSTLTREETAVTVPPAPQLQRDPFGDIARNQARENRMLNNYGWIDADHTAARIPIGRALRLSIGKSLDAGP